MKEAGFASALHDEANVGDRKGYLQVMTGEVDGQARVYMGYFVATDTGLYTLMFSAPKGSDGKKWMHECGSLVHSFSFL
jgi:hypothetical protein